VARSRKLLGPWEKYRGNPILAENSEWKCPGHGSIVEDSSGRTFLLYHAYHPSDSIWVGRQGLLDEVTWGADGWPAINGGKGPGAVTLRGSGGYTDDFNALSPELQWPASQKPSARVRDGWLELSAGGGSDLLQAVVAKPALHASYTAETRLDVAGIKAGASAGLAAYGNARNAAGVSAAKGRLTLWRRDNGVYKELASTPLEASVVQLRMRSTDGKKFDFEYRSGDRDGWHSISTGVASDGLPPWDLGIRVALTCGGAEGATARFDYLRIRNATGR
jgi:beta-xylosidase